MTAVIVHIILLVFVTLTLLVFGVFWVIDLLDKATTLREYAPWLVNLAEHKKWHAVVYLMCWVFLCADGWDLFRKEIPEVPKPPILVVKAPSASEITPLPPIPEPRLRIEDKNGPVNGSVFTKMRPGILTIPIPYMYGISDQFPFSRFFRSGGSYSSSGMGIHWYWLR